MLQPMQLVTMATQMRTKFHGGCYCGIPRHNLPNLQRPNAQRKQIDNSSEMNHGEILVRCLAILASLSFMVVR
jgi:hypothetical protein